ncbi:MAG: preprotein translocase subunit SecY [Paracoccaceae bacterium]|nr:preprotein translocase subunit SecY [Paracoccaceae bacterium]MDE2913753.1 preprotein translocase subunit SecY [Paracoccaceae bacterium]
MASAAEQMAANISWGTFAKAKELQQRILFALALLLVYRVGTFIPVPGIDAVALQQFVEQAQGGIGGILNMFSGGAIGRMAIFALGIMPYISSSIIVQLLAAMVPQLEQLKKEGEQGRKKINQYTRYGTVFLAGFQAFGLAKGLEASELVTNPGFVSFQLPCVITLVGGTMFLMWLGEQITARGIGNGISLIIFVGIIAELPAALAQFFSQGRSGVLSPAVILGVIVMVVVVIAFVVYMERALRKVHIQYPKRQVANNRMYGGQSSHLPIKLNPSGVIPPIFASALLLMPTSVSTFSGTQTSPFMNTVLAYFGPGQPLYLLFFVAMIVFFAYFYTANVAFKTEDVADNLKRQNGFVPGIRPGQKTAEYLDYVVTRLLVLGSAYLSAVCLLPEILRAQLAIPFYFGGTSLLIVVSVTMDTITQVQSHLVAHQYESLIERSRLRGKSRSRSRSPVRR